MSRTQPKLHEAMQSILLDEPQQTATIQRLSEINRERDLYRRGDGDGPHPPAAQFRDRAKQYENDFEILSDGRIKFLDAPSPDWAFLFVWTPENWSFDKLLNLRTQWLNDPETTEEWSSGSRKNIPRGSTIYLLKKGEGGRGIFASGRTASGWYPTPQYFSPNHNKLKFDVFLDPRKHLLDVDQLQDLSTTVWNAKGSGHKLEADIAAKLSERWSDFLSRIDQPLEGSPDGASRDDDYTVDEGSRVPQTHLQSERDQGIVRIKKQLVLQKTGRLACEVCDYDFVDFWGERAKGVCQCHHTKQISKGYRKT